jgi:biotin carboxylase
VKGVKTSIAMHQRILDDPDFVAGDFSTHFMERFLEAD